MPVNCNKVVRKEVAEGEAISPKNRRDFNVELHLEEASWNHYVAILKSRKLFGMPSKDILQEIINDSKALGLIR
jgi:hypothetical protein